MKVTDMKITEVKVYQVKPRWIFVKVITDQGIEGWGEMISGTRTETVVAGAHEMAERFLIGENPFEIERLFQQMHRIFFRGGPVHGTLVSGFEMALWDIKGKYYGMPVYEMLGGKYRDKIRMYGHLKPTGHPGDFPIEENGEVFMCDVEIYM